MKRITLRTSKWSRLGFLFVVIFFALAGTARADTATISQGYAGTNALPLGVLVSNVSGESNKVDLATLDSADNLLGVVVSRDTSAIDFSNQNATVQVGTTGIFNVTVSNINGDIKRDDRISISPIDGVGMKATTSGKIIGVAQADLTESSQFATTKQIADKSGKMHNVLIAQIPVAVSVSYYQAPDQSSNALLSSLQSISSHISGKPVSVTRALVSLLILIISLIIAVIIVYTTIASAIRAIGRNPLSRHSITLSLIFVVMLVIVLIAGAFIMSYYILVH